VLYPSGGRKIKVLKPTKYHSLEIAAPETDYLYVEPSQISDAGLGLYTAIPIFKDEIIGEYGGEIIGSAEAKKRANKQQNQYFINLPNGKILDSINSLCFARYANDACGKENTQVKNNAKIILSDSGKVCLIASKKIKAGEEILCSYGKKYWLTHI
jgi:SET domain-containing protein